MKHIIFCFLVFFITMNVSGQVSNSFKYQAAIRTTSGEIMSSSNAIFSISILQGDIVGANIYQESHDVMTNELGLVSFNIGEGENPTSSFSDIDWANGPYFIQIELNGRTLGTSQLLSVPFAMYAEKAGNAFSRKYEDLTGLPNLSIKLDSAETLNWDKDVSDDFDADYNNLVNKPTFRVSTIGDSLFLGENNYVIIPGVSASSSPNQELEDTRDGQVYRTTTIGTQTWMAENLNYQTPTGSFYYDNDSAAYAQTHGRLYNWEGMMQGEESSSNVPSGVQGACPIGWHVPSLAEYWLLRDFLSTTEDDFGGYLKAQGTEYWHDPNTVIENNHKFDALPSGIKWNSDGAYAHLGLSAYLRTSHVQPGVGPWNITLYSQDMSGYSEPVLGDNGAGSLRCVKD